MHVDRLAGARGAPGACIVSQRARRRAFAVGTAFLIVAWATTAAAARCYVDGAAGGANIGVSWTDAFTDLQSALTDAACTEVWVAQGVYKPVVPVDTGSVTPSEQAVSLDIGPGVAVYGGFAGGETSLAARDPVAHATILSGDLDDNDDSNNADGNFIDETSADIVGSNSRHVVVLNGTAGTSITTSTVLDGFTVTGGDNTNNTDGGGALWCRGNGAGHACSPTLARLVFSGNRANYGGAVALAGYSGGASSPTLTNVTFSGNSAVTFGGAMFNYGEAGSCSPTLSSVTFSGNSSANYGGAMVNDGSSGGISTPTLTNVTFSGNSAVNGGAIFDNGGGGNSSPTLTNVTFNGNSASYGGAMYNQGVSSGSSLPLLNSVIMWGDSATVSGPETFDNAGADGTAGSTFYYAVIEGGCPINGSCSDISASDPKLGALADNGGFTPTMMPGPGSAAIDAVPCYLAPLADQRDAARPDPASAGLTRCDMGAVEAGSVASDFVFADSFGSMPRDL